ncbi:glycosyltransferase family 39 protein [Candidatus Woesebacteria bacterium]|nr:glycosyltransferase family 39 protein [Candidatus Woesebacteria bacterium]
MITTKEKTREILIVLLLFVGFLFVRLFRFNETFHFYYDQPLFSIKALEIWESKDVPLIGPPISFNLEGRQVFQGGIIYLVQLCFLLLGGFDPIRSTLAFIIFAGLMIAPLWAGAKNLAGKKAAVLAVSAYAFLPPLITGTLELTNPYFQLALTPILIWILSKHLLSPTWQMTGLLGFAMGFLLQFHYQYVVVITLIAAFLLVRKPMIKLQQAGALVVGGLIGFAPLILFELRNDFYNLRTIGLYMNHWGEFGKQLGGGSLPFQYFLSLILVASFALATMIGRKIPKLLVLVMVVVMTSWAVRDFVITPTQGGILKDWKYQDELRVNEIVRHEELSNYNVVMWYDTKSITQRYLFLINNAKFDFENYRNNKYLFVVYPNPNWQQDGAYELNTFVPSKPIKEWKINAKYNLYLAERLRVSD